MVVKATADSVDAEERMIPWHKDVVQRVDLEAGGAREGGLNF
jgi:16S rRNA processing protein RimM